MIRALRITSIVVAAIAVIVLILPAVAPARRGTDPKIEEFLKAPGSVQKFTTAKTQGSAGSETQASPLVKEAMSFALYLNPPPPPAPELPPSLAEAAPEVAPTAPVSVKFDLIGTSFYAARPERSLALIDEPGKGLYWIRQGDSVGHLVIEQVKDGSIIIKDGARTSEKTVVVHELWKDLLKPVSASTSEAQPAKPAITESPKSSGVRSAPASRPGAAAAPGAANAGTPAASLPSSRNQSRRPAPGAKPSAQQVLQQGSASPAPDKSTVRQPVKSPPVQPVTPSVQPASPAPEVKQPEQEVQPNNEATITPPPMPTEKEIIHIRLQEEVKASKITPEEAKRMEEMAQTLEQLEALRAAAEKPDSNTR